MPFWGIPPFFFFLLRRKKKGGLLGLRWKGYRLGGIYSGRSMLHNSVILRSRYSMRHLWLFSLACQCVFNLFLVGFVQINPWHTENRTSYVNLSGVGVYLSKGLLKSE